MTDKYFQAIGRRKSAVAQVRVTAGGSGAITVNDRPIEDYFKTGELRRVVTKPLKESGKTESVNISVKASGGGVSGQADATSLGITRALILMDENLRPALKAVGLVTRNPKKKERKKPGKHGARRSPQWRKR
jgi:small subunit ribosomal protein S9